MAHTWGGQLSASFDESLGVVLQIFIYGSGGTGREVLDILHRLNRESAVWTDITFIDDYNVSALAADTHCIRFSDISDRQAGCHYVVAVGEPEARYELKERCASKGLVPATIIDPSAVVSDTCQISPGCIVYANSIISSRATLGENVLVQFGTIVGHDAHVNSHTVVSSGVTLGGASYIGEKCFVGMGAGVKEKLRIGDQSILGMGGMLFNDLDSKLIAIGNPARVIRRNEELRVFGISPEP